ncbi:hypothetical protein J8J14_01965 [Roseomonas sp. SSH11]|uniref:Porin n=1 Tax=Pararoseomonas baculiformis TaxID=2820812 RepID=A0ABS4A961_9PROT|nr:porin [Pararoseomonas baculiformis]MBP0443533.1 hypothetical protein [Pararoseomonas baculiformis]
MSQAQHQAGAQPAPDGIQWEDGKPSLRLGAFTLEPLVRLDADAGSFFGQDRTGGYRSGVNLRRGRLGLEAGLGEDFTARFIWEFGGSSPNDYNNIYEAQLAYTGLGWGTIRIGAFQPQHLPEYAGSSFDLPFMERAAISNIAASLASGSTRLAAGLEARGGFGEGGARWNASAYLTGGVASTPHDHRQRGVAGRAVALLPEWSGLQLQVGLNGAAQFHPGTSPGPESIRLRDYPELRIDSRRFLDSGTIRAGSAWAAGPELAGRMGPLYVEALWQRVEVDAATGPARRYEGWYAEAAFPLLGKPRERSDETGIWKRPKPDGGMGGLELAARYSVADLRDGDGGARQDIWTIGLTWFPTDKLRFGIQYENGRTKLADGNRDFQAVGLRAAFNL